MVEWKFANYPVHNGAFDYLREHSYILPRLGKIDVRGIEVIREMGQGFSAAFYPHTSHADAYTVFHELRKLGVNNIIVAAAADYWFRNPLMRTFGNSVMPIFPQPRPGKEAGTFSAGKALLHLSQRVKEGAVLIWSPEGTRDGNGELNTGIVRLAEKSGRPVVPVVLRGLEKSWPKGQSLPDIKVLAGQTITICFCPPMSYPEQPNKKSEKLFMDKLKQTYKQTYEELGTN